MKRFFVFLLILIVYFGNINASNGDTVHSIINGENISKPVKVNINNLRNMEHVLPTGRKITPVGILNGTPNFAAGVAVYHNLVAVLANGATFVQTITIYDKKNMIKKPWLKLPDIRHLKPEGLSLQKSLQSSYIIQKKRKKDEINKSMSSFIYAKNNNQDLFQGIAFSPDGILYASGGGVNDVIALKLINHRLAVIKKYPLKWQKFSKNQYPYRYQGFYKKPHLFYGDFITISKSGKYLYTSGLLSNSVARINLTTGKTAYANAGPYPFALSLSDNDKRLVVSDWGANGLTVINTVTMKKSGFVGTGEKLTGNSFAAGVHPTAMVSIKGTPDVLVTDSNNDRIYEVDSKSLRVVKVIDDAPYKNAPPGSYPDGITFRNGYIFVANAGNNDIAVYNLKSGKRIGLIPTAWYPTAVAASGDSIYIACAKGLGSGPNTKYQWVADFMDGAVEKVDIDYAFKHIKYLTYRSLKNNGFLSFQRLKLEARNSRITKFLRAHIKHIVFILRENKTFDENFGSYKKAGSWGAPELDLYGKKELPNLYSLADNYALFANFYADGEVTAQGHQWTTGASDSDFVQRTWPEYYSGRGLVGNPGWTEGLKKFNIHDYYKYMPDYDSLKALKRWSNPWISYPERLYIFDDMLKHGVSFKDFGEFVSRNRLGYISNAMKRHIDLKSYAWNRFILDTARAEVFLNFAKKSIKEGKFPQFVYIWLPDDHTAGRNPCYYTPDYYVANNDYATGKIIAYLSHSKVWKNTLIFITEDDAQSGADHIDAHRTFALVIGHYVKKGAIVSRRYSQVNILKTVEAVFKLPPMSQWDANAAVIGNGFTGRPDMTPYNAVPMKIKPALNKGICRSKIDKIRLKMGEKGLWEMQPESKLKTSAAGIPANELYTPVSLLKVPGPEQFKQEWIASKGAKSYKKVMVYIKKLAKNENRPVAGILAGK